MQVARNASVQSDPTVQFVQQGNKLVGTGSVSEAYQGISVSISADGNTAIVRGANDDSGGVAWIFTRSNGGWSQQGSKLVVTDADGSDYGGGVSISGDGNTAIVGSWVDSSEVGAAWIFTRSNGVWSQQGNKLVGTGAVGKAYQGGAVSISGDGNTAIVGGHNDNSTMGAAWIFTRSNGVWSQQGNKLVGTGAVGINQQGAQQGQSVSISEDGNTAIVGGNYDNSYSGAVWIFMRSNGVWAQQGAKLVGTGSAGNAFQGQSVSISGDGNTAIVGGNYDDYYSGAVWIFTRSNGVWSQQGNKLVGTGAVGNAYQGTSVSISGDGNTAIVGGSGDSSNYGAAWIYHRSGSLWSQQGDKLVGTGAVGNANQGASVSISADGNTAIVSGPNDEHSFVITIGAAWIFVPMIAVRSPQTGDDWAEGSTHNIIWVSNDSLQYVKIEYTTNNGSSWNIISAATPASDETLSWKLPYVSSSQCYIRISDTSDVAYRSASSGQFTISNLLALTSPESSDVWGTGTTHNLVWQTNFVENIKIEYTTDNGSTWNVITPSTPALADTFAWKIPDVVSTPCKIRISDANDSTVFAVSGQFSIAFHPFVITGPDPGQYSWSYYMDDISHITWTHDNGAVRAKLEYSTDAGTTWNLISDTVSAQSGLYLWQVSRTPSSRCKLRISDPDNSLNYGVSSGYFSIILPQRRVQLLIDTSITQLPCYVNAMFHALQNNVGVQNLLGKEFSATEDGVSLDSAESRLQISKLDNFPFTFKTVLMLDNSTSIGPSLPVVKNAAINFVRGTFPGQQIAVYSFSETINLLQDYTTDTTALINAINSLRSEFPSTDLYGAVETGVSRWDNTISINAVTAGALVLLTDGKDTQGSSTLAEALATRGNKQVFTLGLGSETDVSALTQLGNGGYYPVADSSQLAGVFATLQNQIVSLSKSFYWLNYVSPKRGNHNHNLTVALNDNLFSGTGSSFTASFSSNGFSPVVFGIVVNPTPFSLFGVDTVRVPAVGSANVTIQTPLTFYQQPYRFHIANDTLLSIRTGDSTTQFIFTGSAQEGMSTNVVINDTTNRYTKTLYVVFTSPTMGIKGPVLPAEFRLAQNYPNPFNPSTSISYQLPKQSYVNLKVFDVLGREVATLVNGQQTAGYKSITWNAENVPSGIYFYRIDAVSPVDVKNHFTQVHKMLLLR